MQIDDLGRKWQAEQMADLPEPATPETIARQLVEVGDELDRLHASMRTLTEIVSRIEANTTAFRAEVRAFNDELRQRDA